MVQRFEYFTNGVILLLKPLCLLIAGIDAMQHLIPVIELVARALGKAFSRSALTLKCRQNSTCGTSKPMDLPISYAIFSAQC